MTFPGKGMDPWYDAIKELWNVAHNDNGTLKGQPVNAQTDFGAKGDATTDDTATIQAALDACPKGGEVLLPAGTYVTTAPLVIPPIVGLRGTHGNRIQYANALQNTALIKPAAAFSGAAVLRLLDKEEGGYSAENVGQRLTNLTIDGVNASGSVDGIKATGYVREVVLENVCVQNVPHNGITTAAYTRLDASSKNPYSWWMRNVIVNNAVNIGFSHSNFTDSVLLNLQTLGCSNDGFFMSGLANTVVAFCRSEWNGIRGFHITSGSSNGVAMFVGCSTDRNTQSGFYIDATGTSPLVFHDIMCRRDGRTGGLGGSGHAGFRVNGATCPVLVTNLTVLPGTDDDGSGISSPQYGFRAGGSSHVQLNGAYLHAATAGLKNDGDNTKLLLNGPITTATGLYSAPTQRYGGQQFIRKTADTARTTNAVLADDPHLTTTLEAGSVHLFEAVLFYDGATTGDLQIGITCPTSATAVWGNVAGSATVAGVAGNVNVAGGTQGFTNTIGAAGAGAKTVAVLKGSVSVDAANSGTFAIRWAQGVSDATATIVYAGSYLTLTQVA